MKTFITSDLHFGHKRIFQFCPRTRGHFRDLDHMHAEMIAAWNNAVTAEDTVYILGDVAFLPAVEAVSILGQLNGYKILIEGNHDHKLLKNQHFRSCFTEIHKYHQIIHNGMTVVMFHYPIHYEWNQAHRGSIHCYGHVHGTPTGLEEYRAVDVGYDATGNVVSLLDDIVENAKSKRLPPTHHGKTNE